MTDYPDNTLTSYKVKLPYTVILEGNWDVGLVEIHYPHRWYNYMSENSSVSYTLDNGESWIPVQIENGYYYSVDHLLDHILPENVLGVSENIRYIFNELTQRVYIDIKALNYGVKFEGDIASMLGFQDGEECLTSRHGKYTVDIEQIHNLYIYSDIAAHQIVGNVRAPLLRTVTVKMKHGNDVSLIYERPHFLPVSKKIFDTVEIDIRDATGRKIPFQRGRVVVKLHFKKSAPSLID